MIAMPIARKHAAASNGATGPKPKFSARRFANSPDIMAIKPFPRKMALENVMDNHCGSKPLCKRERQGKYSDSVLKKEVTIRCLYKPTRCSASSPRIHKCKIMYSYIAFAASGRTRHVVSQAADCTRSLDSLDNYCMQMRLMPTGHGRIKGQFSIRPSVMALLRLGHAC